MTTTNILALSLSNIAAFFLVLLAGLFLGAAVIAGLVLFLRRRKKQPEIHVHTSIEEIRSVGELVVFKVITKEIVTAAEHWFGQWGKKYLQWLASTSKMAMIFEFEVDFRYDLRSSSFHIEEKAPGAYNLKMPPCFYEIRIRDILFYDEHGARLLPWLLPDLLNRAFGPSFDENDKNRLKEEAKTQAVEVAKNFVQKMRSEVQTSARQTLEALAQAFGAHTVSIDFSEAKLIQTKIESDA